MHQVIHRVSNGVNQISLQFMTLKYGCHKRYSKWHIFSLSCSHQSKSYKMKPIRNPALACSNTGQPVGGSDIKTHVFVWTRSSTRQFVRSSCIGLKCVCACVISLGCCEGELQVRSMPTYPCCLVFPHRGASSQAKEGETRGSSSWTSRGSLLVAVHLSFRGPCIV